MRPATANAVAVASTSFNPSDVLSALKSMTTNTRKINAIRTSRTSAMLNTPE